MELGEVNLIDPRPKRDYIHIDDLVSLIKTLVLKETFDKKFSVYNAGFGRSYSIQELVGYIKEISGKEFTVNFSHEYRKNEVLDLYADISKASTELSWMPKIDLYEGVKRLL